MAFALAFVLAGAPWPVSVPASTVKNGRGKPEWFVNGQVRIPEVPGLTSTGGERQLGITVISQYEDTTMDTTTRVRLRSNSGQKDAEGHNIRVEAWLTLNWEGITQEELDKLATDQVKILASHYFKQREEIPEGEISLNVRDVMPGGPRKARKQATIEDFSAEQLKAQLRKLGFDL